ncbi:MAG TPA: hypothetical protein PKC76_10545 [Saprospiraceae bacterium]|nr:hypothetical protein [Saprospiraceae bacterium]HMP24562.1 hypothetical protein [Saprospiraceae bacterium]
MVPARLESHPAVVEEIILHSRQSLPQNQHLHHRKGKIKSENKALPTRPPKTNPQSQRTAARRQPC